MFGAERDVTILKANFEIHKGHDLSRKYQPDNLACGTILIGQR
jgi:hypothetical protein